MKARYKYGDEQTNRKLISQLQELVITLMLLGALLCLINKTQISRSAHLRQFLYWCRSLRDNWWEMSAYVILKRQSPVCHM